MKIAFLSVFYPYRGGIAQFNAALYRALEVNNQVKAFNFTVQYPNFLFPGKTQFVTPEDNVDEVPSERVLNAINPLSYKKTVASIKEFQPDLLILGYWMPFMGPSMGYIAKKIGKECRVLSIVHNAIPHETSRLDKILSNYFFRRNTHCVALSKAVESDLIRNYPHLETKVLLHPVYEHFGKEVNREEAADELRLSTENKYILFFGLIRDYKGLDQLLLALEKLDSNIHLIIAGEVYGSFDKYQKIIDEKKLSERVHLFLKYIPDEQVKYYFSLASSVVLPYKSGTQSGIIAIAKHFNKNVVVTDVGGLSEFIQSEQEGFVVPADDVEQLVAGIKQALAVQSGISTSDSTYSWKDFAKELIKFLDSVR